MKRPSPKRIATACVIVVLCLIPASVLLGVIDTRLQRAPHPGFAAPGGIVWYLPSVTTWDAGMADATGNETLSKKLLPRLHGVQVQSALATRWTTDMSRWQGLFGQHLVLADHGDDWMVCLRPGLLGHLLVRTNGFWGRVALEQIFPAQAWRDGFFIGGTPSAVQAAVDAAPLESRYGRDIFSRVSPDAALACEGDASPVQAILRAAPGLPVDIYLPDAPDIQDGMLYPIGGAEPAALSVTATTSAAARALLTHVLGESWFNAFGTDALSAHDQWQRHLPERSTDADAAAQATVLRDDVQWVAQYPVPAWGEVWRWAEGTSPGVLPMSEDLPAYPMMWNSARGWSAPLLGPLVGVHLAARDRVVTLTSTEPLMARATSWSFCGAGRRAVVLVQIDGPRLANILDSLARQENGARADNPVFPLFRQLGQIELWGVLEDRPEQGTVLHFAGYLDASKDSGA